MFLTLSRTVFLLSIFLTKGLSAEPSARLARSKFDSVNGLFEIQSESQKINVPGFLQLQFLDLEDLLPSFDARRSFQQDWLNSLVSMAEEMSQVINQKASPGPSRHLFAWSEDPKLLSLFENGTLSLPLRHALLRLTNSQWLEFKSYYVKALQRSEEKLKYSRWLSPAKGLALNAFNDKAFMHGWALGKEDQLHLKFISQQQLRALELVEIIFANSYCSPEQIESWFRDNFLLDTKSNEKSDYSEAVRSRIISLAQLHSPSLSNALDAALKGRASNVALLCVSIFKK